MFVYLKRFTPGSESASNLRVFCIVLSLMQVFTPLFSMLIMLIQLAKTTLVKDIVKDSVTLLFINDLDKIYLTLYQDEVKANLQEVNKSGRFKISNDSNSTFRLINRVMRDYKKMRLYHWLHFIFDMVFNMVFFLLVNFNVIFFNYCMPISIIVYQVFGYYHQQKV